MEENSAVFNVVPMCWLECEDGHDFVLWPNESSSVGEQIKTCVSPSDDWRQCPVIRKTPLIDDYNLAKEFEAIIMRMGSIDKGYKAKALAVARNKRVVMKTSNKFPGESSSSDEAACKSISPCFTIPQRGEVTNGAKRAKTSLSESENITLPRGGDVPEEECFSNLLSLTSDTGMVAAENVEAVLQEMHGGAVGHQSPEYVRKEDFDAFVKEYRENQIKVFAFCREIISNQMDIKGDIRRQERPKAKENEAFHCPIALPVQSYQSLMEVEMLLQSDEGFRSYMFREFSGCLAENLGIFVRHNLSKVMSNYVGTLLNWNGIRSKKALLTLTNLLSVVKDAARQVTGRLDDVTFKREISQWLSQANRRKDGRKNSEAQPEGQEEVIADLTDEVADDVDQVS